jgi:hypothetical protein
LIDDVFFNELLLSGRAANSGTGVGFAEGYAAINALYPGSRNASASTPNPYSGSLDLISSQIYTLSGGNISILVPGGSIDVGLAFTPVGIITPKSPGQLGIVAEGSGNIGIYAAGDVNVNSSRIFTLGGGNILIWSDLGSIDAGNGSKSSLSVPPPTVLVNADGSVTIDFGGTASGVPSDLSGLAASLSGVSAVGSSATNSSTGSVSDANEAAREVAPLAQTALSWLEVFVTGLGEENCKQEDVECLKRQKAATQ